MTDIVERLRAPGYWTDGSGEEDNQAPSAAADEIKRLRDVIDNYTKDHNQFCVCKLCQAALGWWAVEITTRGLAR